MPTWQGLYGNRSLPLAARACGVYVAIAKSPLYISVHSKNFLCLDNGELANVQIIYAGTVETPADLKPVLVHPNLGTA